MRRILIGLTFFFYVLSVGMSLASADIVVITDKNRIPKYVLDTATGKTTQVNGVYVEGGEAPTPPVPPADPPTNPPQPPPDGNTVRDRIGNAGANLRDANTAKLLSLLYAEASEQIRLGEASLASVRDTLDFSFDLMVKRAGGNVQAWKTVKNLIESEHVRIRQEGGLRTDAEWVTFFMDVSFGLNKATNNAAFGDITKWLKIVACIFEGLD